MSEQIDDVRSSVFIDLHIHSKYSRATSKDLNIENLAKGILTLIKSKKTKQ